MIDIANLHLDDLTTSSRFLLQNMAMHKNISNDGVQHYYPDNPVNTTQTSLKNFVFPRPPQVQSSIVRPQSTSSNNGTSDSDTQSDTDCRCRPKSRPKRSSPISIRTTSLTSEENLSGSSPKTLQSLPALLPPIGVFWDIENCNVPKGCSAVLVAQVIRASFFEGYREAEFVVVCDVTKEPSKVIEELNDAQVNLIHVPSLHKNAADEKLRQSMRRFADIHGSPAAVVLITGDINFLSDVCDLRHRRKLHVILLHRDNTSEALILCANENYNIVRLFEALPPRENKVITEQFQLIVYNLPDHAHHPAIRNRLKRISDNCGGRVGNLLGNGMATLIFTSIEYASRAQKRMEGADVYGNKITVGEPTPVRGGSTPTKQPRQPNGRNYLSSSAPQQQAVAAYGGGDQSPTALLPLPPCAANSWMSNAVPKQNSAFGHPSQARKVWDGKPGGQWNPTWPGQVTNTECQPQRKIVKNTRDKTPENMRSIVKKNQDRDCILMPPPPPSMQVPPPSQLASGRNQPQRSALPSKENRLPKNGQQLQANQSQHYFHPISTTARPQDVVELQVSNLDHFVDPKDLKTLLVKLFGEYVMVIHVSVYAQSDGEYAARIKVPSLQAAQYAISQLHRRRVGFKRIVIKYANTDGPSPQVVRSQIVSLLTEVPSHRLPLFKFRELFESRYLSAVGVSELYKLKDVCLITDEVSGRVITLNPDHRNSPSPTFNMSQDLVELPYCTLHAHRPGQDKGWAEQEVDALPSVRIGLKELTYRVHTLIQSHKGSIPLASLPHCYEAQFHALEVDETGVPLEHLVSCLPDVEIYQGNGSAKYLRWAAGTGVSDEPTKCVSPPLILQQTQFCRELVDLLKMSPHCQLSFNRFIPAYHHHFGRQCRVADYGYIKLIDLLEALTHTVQVLGDGNNRNITLAHKVQVRRFTSDLLRILKRATNKQILLSELPAVFTLTLGKEFDIVDYGVCHPIDMLSEVNQTMVQMVVKDNDVEISITKRTQTPEEVARTEKFAYEIEDLGDGERSVSLTHSLSLSVLANQMARLVRSTGDQSLLLADLPAVFKYQYGYAMKPETYGCTSIIQVMQLLGDTIAISDSGASGPVARLANTTRQRSQALKVWWVMAEHRKGLTGADFLQAYWKRYNETVDLNLLVTGLGHVVEVDTTLRHYNEGEIFYTLTDDWWLAHAIYKQLMSRGGCMALSELQSACAARQPNLASVLPRIADVVTLLPGGTVTLSPGLAEAGIETPVEQPSKLPDTNTNRTPTKMPSVSWLQNGPTWNSCIKPDQYQLFGSPRPWRYTGGLSLLLPSMKLQECSSPASGGAYYGTPAVPQRIMAPDASQLPMPISLASNSERGGVFADDGWLNVASHGEQMYSSLTGDGDDHTGNFDSMMFAADSVQARATRKKRMAAQFSSPIQA